MMGLLLCQSHCCGDDPRPGAGEPGPRGSALPDSVAVRVCLHVAGQVLPACSAIPGGTEPSFTSSL